MSSLLQFVSANSNYLALVILAVFWRQVIWVLNAARKLFVYYLITPPIRNVQGKRMPGPGPLVDTRFTRFAYTTSITKEYGEKYGPAFVVHNDTVQELVLAHPDSIQTYFANDGRVHRKSWGIGFGYYFYRLLGNAVGTKHNEDWHRVRRVVDPHFTNGVIKNMIPNVSRDFEEWFAKLEKHPALQRLDEKGTFEMEFLSVSERTPFKIVCRALFDPVMTDKDVDHLLDLDSIHSKIVQTAFLGNIEQYWLYKYLPTAANRRIDQWDKDWDAILFSLVQRARDEGQPNPISMMFEAVEQGTLTRFELWQTIDEIMYTNIDVTSNTLAWALIMIGQKDTIVYQDRVREEMRKALYSDDEKWGAGQSEEERIARYLFRSDTLIHYCVLETMRMVPLLFYALPEVTAEPKIIDGYVVPAGTSVLIDAESLNHRAPCWQPDGDVYRPERFFALDPITYRYSLWRYGLGPRKCVGQFFADKIVKGFLFHGLRDFRFEVATEIAKKKDMFVQTPEGKFKIRRVARV